MDKSQYTPELKSRESRNIPKVKTLAIQPLAPSTNPDDYHQEIVGVCSFIKDRDNKVIFFFQMVGEDHQPLIDLENHYKALGWHCHWILNPPEKQPEQNKK